MCIFTYGLSSSRSTFFFAIFLLFPRGRDFLSVFVVTFCLLSSRRRQQHPKRLCRRATAEPHWETLSLSPFSFSPRRAERVVGKSSSNSSRHRRSIMVDEQRTTDNDRENAEGDDDGATAPVPEKVTTLLLKHRHRFFAFDDKTTKQSESRVCFRRSSSKVAL